ncbi:cytochrome P450 [Roseicyclus persicicus]|uniref:Cytochrome P450 n=1 Tax=Roseicyclus persicicus TaxID=2650661 RepID=A0A7X6JYC1_9RHOB|nr:cytochrome P450 [Roseibacterium persicicum]NKX43930.1 cytochrome P450 [Roseibacterium persicicum]
MQPPVRSIDARAFWADPYPTLAAMRAETPVVRVPELGGAILLTKRADIHREEKRVEVFSSRQPNGLMTRLMGENLMRRDGEAHLSERRALFPALSPRTVREVWLPLFQARTAAILDALAPQGQADLVRDYAMPVSAEALKLITGLTNMAAPEMDRVSQGMIDGCANYGGDAGVEARCHDCTASIDRHIDAAMPGLMAAPDHSALSVMHEAGLGMDRLRANVKLIISGGQNEPRDAIAGAAWAVLTHPEVREAATTGALGWDAVFAEYARWMSPIGMSPREVARLDAVNGVEVRPGERVFLMFGSGNRDEDAFSDPDHFDPWRDGSAAIPFGAGPHFCAGAAASKALIAEVALPMLFERLPGLRLAGDAPFGGWAFRGPLRVPVAWGP